MARKKRKSPTFKRVFDDDMRDPSLSAHVRFAATPDDDALERCGRRWATFVATGGEEHAWRQGGPLAAISYIPDSRDGDAPDELAALLLEIHAIAAIESATIFVGSAPTWTGEDGRPPAFERGMRSPAPPSDSAAPATGPIVETALGLLRKHAKQYGETVEGLRAQLMRLGAPDEATRAAALEAMFSVRVPELLETDRHGVLELVSSSDPSDRVRALAILLLGDMDWTSEKGVPVGVLVRVVEAGLADPSPRVRESAALVLYEKYLSSPSARDKLPAVPWAKNPKEVRRWPLAYLSGELFFGVDPPKRLPTYFAEEIIRRLSLPAHRKPAAGVHYLRRIGKPLPAPIEELIRERTRRESPPPDAIRLRIHVLGSDDEVRSIVSRHLQADELWRRRAAFDEFTGPLDPTTRLAAFRDHADVPGLAEHIERALRAWPVRPEEADAHRPLLTELAASPVPRIAKAAAAALAKLPD